MKKFLAFLLAAMMVFAMAIPALAEGEVFLWDNFDDRDPNAKPELGPHGMNIWWDNWAPRTKTAPSRSTTVPRSSILRITTAKKTTTLMLPTGWATGAKP